MKTKLLTIWIALVGFMAATNLWSMPPIPHRASGVVTSVDYDSHTLTVAPSKGGEPLVFVWKDFTRFREHGRAISPRELKPGQSIKLSYRREVGQLVPREINLRDEISAERRNCERREGNDQ